MATARSRKSTARKTTRKIVPKRGARKAAAAAAAAVGEIAALDPGAGVARFREQLELGEPWYPALLGVIGRWVAAEEDVGGVLYRYLIAGEAFDWLRLAERLLEAVGELVPVEEAERLVLFGLPPDGGEAQGEEFARSIGTQKHRGHLNFVYGVVVEEALLLSAERELQKAGSLSGSSGGPVDVAAYERVYGKSFPELAVMYRAESGAMLGERVRVPDLQAFTYWCSKYRFRMGEPARVASDTRKALALLSTMESGRARLGGLSAAAAREIMVDG